MKFNSKFKSFHSNVVCEMTTILFRPQWVKITRSGGMTYVSTCETDWLTSFNTLRLRQNGRHFTDDPFKCIFLNETVKISIKLSLNFVPKWPINNIPVLIQVTAWRRPGDKPLPEPMMVKLLTHICISRPQWVKVTKYSCTGLKMTQTTPTLLSHFYI